MVWNRIWMFLTARELCECWKSDCCRGKKISSLAEGKYSRPLVGSQPIYESPGSKGSTGRSIQRPLLQTGRESGLVSGGYSLSGGAGPRPAGQLLLCQTPIPTSYILEHFCPRSPIRPVQWTMFLPGRGYISDILRGISLIDKVLPSQLGCLA